MKDVDLTDFRRELPQVVISFAGPADPGYAVKSHGRLAFVAAGPSWMPVIDQVQQCDQAGALLPREQMLAILRRLAAVIEKDGQNFSIQDLLIEIAGQAKISADYVRLQAMYDDEGEKTRTMAK